MLPNDVRVELTAYAPVDTTQFFGTAAYLRGAWTPLANFIALIREQERTVDGETEETRLVIEAKFRDGPPRQIALTAKEFAAMQWPLTHWGADAIVYASDHNKDHLRIAIQRASKPITTTVYSSMGWHDNRYVGAEHSIGTDGRAKTPTKLPDALRNHTLADPDPTQVRHLWQLIDGIRPDLAVALIAALFRAPLATSDFALHLHGGSGTFKTETASLIASAYGPELNSRNAVQSWASTVNALETIAYYTKESLLVVDDFAPQATAGSAAQLNAAADRLFRAAGNQAGRARLGDGFGLAQTRWPRCLLLSTGEDIPTGQSVRARMLNIDVSKNDIEQPALTRHQANRQRYAPAFAAYLQWLAAPGRIDAVRQRLVTAQRGATNGDGHARTAYATQSLLEALRIAAEWTAETGQETIAATVLELAPKYFGKIATDQERHIVEQTNTTIYLQALRQRLRQGDAAIYSVHGGPPRINPAMLGWQWSETQWTTKHQPLGWCDRAAIYLDPDIAWTAATRTARDAGTPISSTKQTLTKRLVDEGKIAARDGARQRNTIRKTCDGRSREVLALHWSALFDPEDLQDDHHSTNDDNDASPSDNGPRTSSDFQ